MTRLTTRLFALLTTLLPAAALASATPLEMLDAMDIDPGWIVAGSAEAPDTQPGMFATRTSLGVLSPQEGADFSLMYTGDTDLFPSCMDHDWAPTLTEIGDHVTLTFELDVPAGAHSLSFKSYFLSREYPEYVGSKYNDAYTATLEGDAYTGSIIFDAFGNPITVNSALFAVTDPALLAGTCFDDGSGGTGWLQIVAPVTPETRIRLTFELWDEADGILDSLAIIDAFEFDEDEIDEPIVDPVPEDPLRIGFVSPKEGSMEGGGEVTIFGYGFDEATEVWWDGAPLDVEVSTGGETLRVSSVPSHDAPEPIDIEVWRGAEHVELQDGYTYWELAGGDYRPVIWSVEPGTAHPDGGSRALIEGTGFMAGAEVDVVDADGTRAAVDVVELVGPEDGEQHIDIVLPGHAEGWVDLVVMNPSGLDSQPAWPLEYSITAVSPDPRPVRPGPCGCQSGASGEPLAAALLLLLPLAARLRRRR